MNLKLGGGSYRETAMHAEACQNLKIETKSNNKLRLRCAEFLHRKTWCHFFSLSWLYTKKKQPLLKQAQKVHMVEPPKPTMEPWLKTPCAALLQ